MMTRYFKFKLQYGLNTFGIRLKSLNAMTAIAIMLITIINFSNIDRVQADTSLFVCKNAGDIRYQDLPCTQSSLTNGSTNSSTARQTELEITTANTGFTNNNKISSNSSSGSGGGYFSSYMELPNTYQDSYIPEEIDIEKQRKIIKQKNHELRCQALRKELWRLDFGQHKDKQKSSNTTVKPHPWVVRRRQVVQKHLSQDCQAS